MTRDERIRAEEARARAALPYATFAFGSIDPDVCRVIVDNLLFICRKFPRLGARLVAVRAVGEDLNGDGEADWPEGTYAYHDEDATKRRSTILFRESQWLGDNDRAAHTTAHELSHAAGAEIDLHPQGKIERARLMRRKGMDQERWADACGAFFQRRPLRPTNALSNLVWKYCR